MRASTTLSTLRWAVAGLVGVALVAVPGVASAWPDGDTAPVSAVTGPNTGLLQPVGVAFDAKGRMYVADLAGAIRVFPKGASGDVAPTKTLVGVGTGLGGPVSIAFDSAGRMYVANAELRSITVYAADWASGNTAPIKTLAGPKSGLVAPFGIALDSSDRLYVADLQGNSISMFPAKWADGDRRPMKYLGGVNSGIDGPTSVSFDEAGQMYVTNVYANSVTVYRAGWPKGDVPPVKVLTGPDTGLAIPMDVAFDGLGRMNVLNRGDLTCVPETVPSVRLWPGDWAAGNTAPTKVLAGANTRLRCPYGVAFGPTGLMSVTDGSDVSVLFYPGDVAVSIKGTRTSPTSITLAGVTTGVERGASITAYVRIKGSGRTFVAQEPITLKKGDLAKGTFAYPIAKLKKGKAYEAYVTIGTATSSTITVKR